jgi:hypothetical protein
LRPRREQAAPTDSGQGDPLAELARLIGQNDPFAEFGRDQRRGPGQFDPPAGAADWRSQREPRDYDTAHGLPPAPPHFADPERPHAVHDQFDDLRMDPHRDAPQGREQTYREPQFAAQDQRLSAEPRYPAAPHPVRDDDQYYQDDAHLLPQNSEYDDPPKRRGNGLPTVVALIVCALLGTAGAYAYRTYYSSVDASRSPRTIEAEKSPTKVAVTPTEPQPKASDRIDNERVVPRQEQPVDLRDQPGATQPRVIFPNLINTPTNAPSQAAPAQKAAPTPAQPATRQPPAAVSTEPKRVRTVTIRPNAPDPTAQAAVPPPVAVAPPTPPPPAARTAPAPRVVNAPTRPSNAPLSLTPAQDDPPPAPPQTRARLAAAPPPSAPTRLAPAPAGPGGYAVQVSSQRSEAEANASYRALQARFPALAKQPHFVKRADLGSKGVYYRAMVGPFASADQASQFCNSLKAAGGQCIIQRN